MGQTVTSISQLVAALNKKAQEALESDVAPIVKRVLKDSIQAEVYDSYSPKRYHRRKADGGLMDENNIHSDVRNCTLTVKNHAPLAPGYPNSDFTKTLDEIIVTGSGYDYLGYGGAYEQPRDFYSIAKRQLSSSKEHVKAFRNGLKKRGVHT